MVESSQKQKVLITGITGYLGSRVTEVFLNDGRFQIRGTVRSKTNMKKLQPLIDHFGEEKFREIELVEADLLNSASIENACEGMDIVVHTASPFPSTIPKKESDVIRPAVEGTMAAIRGVHKFKVKRIVITSSIVSVIQQDPAENITEFDETMWSRTDHSQPYDKSKTLAERAAWDYLQQLPDEEKFEISTICPSLILGPSFIKTDFTSSDLIRELMSGKYPGLARIAIPIVDVREVALAHLAAAVEPAAKNQRFLLVNKPLWMAEIAKILNEAFPNYKIATKELPRCGVKMASFFNPKLKLILPLWGQERTFHNEKSREILKIEYRDMKETLTQMAETLIEFGYIKDKRGSKK